jgi:hypothetical protein
MLGRIEMMSTLKAKLKMNLLPVSSTDSCFTEHNCLRDTSPEISEPHPKVIRPNAMFRGDPFLQAISEEPLELGTIDFSRCRLEFQ